MIDVPYLMITQTNPVQVSDRETVSKKINFIQPCCIETFFELNLKTQKSCI